MKTIVLSRDVESHQNQKAVMLTAKNGADNSVFMHCTNGSISVTEEHFVDNGFEQVFNMHGYEIRIEDADPYLFKKGEHYKSMFEYHQGLGVSAPNRTKEHVIANFIEAWLGFSSEGSLDEMSKTLDESPKNLRLLHAAKYVPQSDTVKANKNLIYTLSLKQIIPIFKKALKARRRPSGLPSEIIREMRYYVESIGDLYGGCRDISVVSKS